MGRVVVGHRPQGAKLSEMVIVEPVMHVHVCVHPSVGEHWERSKELNRWTHGWPPWGIQGILGYPKFLNQYAKLYTDQCAMHTVHAVLCLKISAF
jgi:hypothetical protein